MHAQDSCACTPLSCMHNTLVHAQNSKTTAAPGQTRGCFLFGSRPWPLAPAVHAQECCACTRVLCTHKNLVHAQESCACTRILTNKTYQDVPDVPRRTQNKVGKLVTITRISCMHKILVRAQHSCACTPLLCMHWRGQGPRPGANKKAAAGPARGGALFWVPALSPGPGSS